MRITFLGTGTSHGVPRIACDCAVCTSTDPKNKRLRTSIHIACEGQSILVDTTPDLRLQALTYHITSVDAILFTHSHADHVSGLDDVRRFCSPERAMPCYGSPACLQRIRILFDYAVWEERYLPGMPKLELLPVAEPFQLGQLTVTPIPIHHGNALSTAFRFDHPNGRSVAYATDCSSIPETSLARLHDLELLILDALRHRPHPTHLTVAQAVSLSRDLQPKQTLLTHIDHDLDHEPTNAQLPPNVQLGYDGQVIVV